MLSLQSFLRKGVSLGYTCAQSKPKGPKGRVASGPVWVDSKQPSSTTLYLLYVSLCTGELNAIPRHKCFRCSPLYGGACRWAMLGELKPNGPKGLTVPGPRLIAFPLAVPPPPLPRKGGVAALAAPGPPLALCATVSGLVLRLPR